MRSVDDDLFFFYGTLRRGLDLYLELGLTGRVEPVGEGTGRGRIHDLGGYPGLVDDEDGRVHGEVVRIGDPEIVRRIDEAELGYGYERVRRRIEGEAGTWTAWVYVYRGPVPPGSEVAGGDWSRYRPNA